MKATVEISKETADRIVGALNLPPIYDEDALSYAINLMVELCAD